MIQSKYFSTFLLIFLGSLIGFLISNELLSVKNPIKTVITANNQPSEDIKADEPMRELAIIPPEREHVLLRRIKNLKKENSHALSEIERLRKKRASRNKKRIAHTGDKVELLKYSNEKSQKGNRYIDYIPSRSYRSYRPYRAYQTKYSRSNGSKKVCTENPYDYLCFGTEAHCKEDPKSMECVGTKLSCMTSNKSQKECQGTLSYCRQFPTDQSCFGTHLWCSNNNYRHCQGTRSFCENQEGKAKICRGTKAYCLQGWQDRICRKDDR